MKYLCLLIVGVALFLQPAWADENETLGQELWRDIASPVTTPAVTPLAIGSGATLIFYAFKYEVGDPLQESWQEHKPLGQWSQYGNDAGQWVPNLIYAGGMAISGWGYENKQSKARTILMLKATLYSSAWDEILKISVREPRPNGSSDMASFPSGHATTAFAFAAVVGAEHAWYYGVAAYSLATFVAASRINDNMHRLHDVVGGATIGMSYGLGLYYRQHPEEISSRSTADTVFQILPTERMDGMTVSAFREF